MINLRRSLLLLSLMLLSIGLSLAHAHESGYATVGLNLIEAEKPRLTVELDIIDLEFLLEIDANHDGSILWGEYLTSREKIAAYIAQSLDIEADGDACKLLPRLEGGGIRERNPPSVLSAFTLECAATIDSIVISSRLLSGVDRDAATMVVVTGSGADRTMVLGKNPVQINFAETGFFSANLSFVKEGIHHILIGYDHLAFLLLLLLPAARRGSGKERILSLLAVVTSFTLAHSVTLVFAATGFLNLPGQFVETSIALSVVVAGLINIIRPSHKLSWVIAYCFGLIHGFGFAGALAELAIADNLRLFNLAAFNIGVELGQVALVLLAVPLLALLGSKAFYHRYLVRLISLATSAFGVIWVIERLA